MASKYLDLAVDLARTHLQPEPASTRERQLVNVARSLARFLDYRTHGQHDRITLARELQAVLLQYDDLEPIHGLDREEWLKRRDGLAQADDPRRI